VPIDSLRDFFFWSAVVNYCVLACWFLALLLARGALYRLHARWFRLSAAQFDTIHYSAMAVYKVGILLLNVVPYIAVRLVLRGAS
jgi:hypothetical protein